MNRLPFLLLWTTVAVQAAEPLIVSRATPLLAQCGQDDQSGGAALATLEPGQQLKLRFALAGTDNRCYSVSWTDGDRRLAGYVSKADVAGLESFDRERRNSSSTTSRGTRSKSLSVTPAPEATVESAGRPAALLTALRSAIEAQHARRPDRILEILDEADAPADDRDVTVLRGQAYLYMTRPSEALEILQPALERNPQDPDILGLIGFAFSQQDRPRQAVEYLDRSLALRPNASYEALRKAVARETAANGEQGQAFGSRFTLRYEGDALPDEKARALVKEFEGQVNRIQFRLGCRSTDRLPVIIRTMDGYRRASGVAQWAGGHYDGRIHIAVPPSGDADEYVRETFAHEFVHACLSQKGVYPLWLHEGMAQRLSGRVTSESGRQTLAAISREDLLPSLNQLAGGWSHLNSQSAMVAYGLAAFAVETLYEQHRDDGVRSLLNSPHRIPTEARKLDDAIKTKLGSR